MKNGHRILYLSGAEVRAACRMLDPLAEIRKVFCLKANGDISTAPESIICWKSLNAGAVRSASMPTAINLYPRQVGVKVINSNPTNSCAGIRRASGVTILFTEDTGQIACVLEGSFLSSLRTAATTVLAAQLLARSSCEAVGLVGAGVIGRQHTELLLKYLPAINSWWIYDTDQTRAKKLASDLTVLGGIGVHVASDAEGAIRNADLLITATTATKGYIQFEWLKAGCLVSHVSLDDLLPDAIMKADRLVVDDWTVIAADERRLFGRMHREGKICGPGEGSLQSEARQCSELGDIVHAREVARRHQDEVIVFNPFGLAAEDIIFASAVQQIAIDHGQGVWLSE